MIFKRFLLLFYLQKFGNKEVKYRQESDKLAAVWSLLCQFVMNFLMI
jgi:hypothetical protein